MNDVKEERAKQRRARRDKDKRPRKGVQRGAQNPSRKMLLRLLTVPLAYVVWLCLRVFLAVVLRRTSL